MAHAQAEIVVNASPDATWSIVRNFHGLDEWMPGIEELVSDGDDRVLSMMGMSIRERLVACDEDARAITYSIVDGVPVESHEATITVLDEGDGSARRVVGHRDPGRDGRTDAGHVPAGPRAAEDQGRGKLIVGGRRHRPGRRHREP